MPPVHSKGSRSDFSGTPRGFRTEKGNAPSHQAKGGKSDYTETPRGKGTLWYPPSYNISYNMVKLIYK